MSNVVTARGDREEVGCAVSVVNRGIFAIRQAYLVRYRGDRCFIRFPNDTEMVLPSYPTMGCMCIPYAGAGSLVGCLLFGAVHGHASAVVEQDHKGLAQLVLASKNHERASPLGEDDRNQKWVTASILQSI